MRFGKVVVSVWLVLMWVIAPAHAEKRVALVVGNATYRHADKLDNPVNDAQAMRDVLKTIGFDVVYGENLDLKGLGRALGQFAGRVDDADVALVYFAGHGATFGDTSYAVPVDAEFASLTEVTHELIPVETLIADLRRAKGVRIAILDACRDNASERELKRQVAMRGSGEVTRGLAPMRNTSGLIIAYATQYGATAADTGVASLLRSSTAHSPFTAALLHNIATPGLDVKDMFYRVGAEVDAATAGGQQPEISVSMYRPYVLVPTEQMPPGAEKPAQPHVPVPAEQASPAAKPPALGAGPLPVRQKANLYEEDPATPSGTQVGGNVVWHTERVTAGQTAETVIQGNVEIPDRRLSLQVSVHRNKNPALPASHTVDVAFKLPPDFTHGGIENIPGILMKQDAASRGVSLTGAVVRVTDNFFLVGLSSADTEMQRNVQLLKERNWLDIPIVYSDGKRALIAIEKGPSGEREFSEAFAAWDALVPGQPPNLDPLVAPKSVHTVPIHPLRAPANQMPASSPASSSGRSGVAPKDGP